MNARPRIRVLAGTPTRAEAAVLAVVADALLRRRAAGPATAEPGWLRAARLEAVEVVTVSDPGGLDRLR
jgi:hypothetical protein